MRPRFSSFVSVRFDLFFARLFVFLGLNPAFFYNQDYTFFYLPLSTFSAHFYFLLFSRF